MNAPIIQDSRLFLPRLQSRAVLNLSKIQLSPDDVSIPVSDAFLKVWTQGPTSHSHAELARCLVILCTTFAELVRAGQGRVKSFSKVSPSDLVTDVDRGIEMLFRLWIRQFYPTHKIIGEEGYKDAISPDDYVWYIDPVDGTTNFVEGNPRVSMHVGCVHQGKPVWSFLGLPIQNLFYASDSRRVTRWTSATLDSPDVLEAFPVPSMAMGTEYMSSRKTEDRHFHQLCSDLGLEPIRTKSIGVTLSEFLTGELTAFYKPKAKLWDVMAPLGVVQGLFWKSVVMEIGIHELPDRPMTFFPLFSNDLSLYHHFNQCHLSHCRAGLVLAYPRANPQIKAQILRHFS